MIKHCLGCSYRLDGLPENRCPECGRPFDPDDPTTYREARPALRLRMTPTLLGWLGVALYVVSFLVLGSLGSNVKSRFWMTFQAVEIVAGVVLAVVVVAWGWVDRQRSGVAGFLVCCLPAGILMFLALAVLLPSYLRCLEDIEAVNAVYRSRFGGSP